MAHGQSFLLGRQASFWVSAAVVAHTLWTSAAPAMTYPLYAVQWGLTPFVTTAIFAIYPIQVVVVLVLFGNLSDYIGRRSAMLYGLAFSLMGVLLFAVAPSVGWLFLGRDLMGIGVGLSAGPSAAAMLEFSAPGKSERTGAITTAAQCAGLILAAVVGGGLIQYAPYPTRLNFIVLLAALVAIFVATWFLPHHSSTEAKGRWRPRAVVIPREVRKAFVTATVAVTASYVLGSITLSIGAQIAHDVIGSSNVLVNGGTIAVFAIVASIVAIVMKPLSTRTAIILGGITSVGAVALLTLSAVEHSLVIFVATAIASGAGYTLLFAGGLTLINKRAPVHHRGGTLSALFLAAYLTQALVALLLGQIATAFSLLTAIEIGSVIIATLSLASLLLAGVDDWRSPYQYPD